MPTPNYRAALAELLAHFNAMQDFCAQYMPPDSGITEHDFANNMIGFLDGPEQRRVQAYARAVLAEPEAGPPVKLSSLRGIASLPPGMSSEDVIAQAHGDWTAPAPGELPEELPPSERATTLALRLAKGALLECSPCAAEDCKATQQEWLADAITAIDRALAAIAAGRWTLAADGCRETA
jgi:hypothetical protein